jgi:hypothetical protein
MGTKQILSLEKFSLTWRTSLRISRILQSLFNVWLPHSVQHMRQNGWLADEKLDSPSSTTSRIQSSDIRNTPQPSPATFAPPRAGQSASQVGMPQAAPLYQPHNPTSSALNFSTWFNSPPTDQAPQSLDSILYSINEPQHNPLYPFANASLQSPAQSTTPSSHDFLRQLLSQQQYQSQGHEYSDPSNLPRPPDLGYNPNWNEPVSTTEILSNFDFSIEAFNEMLKSSAAEAESV